jgi:hypothetical protein
MASLDDILRILHVALLTSMLCWQTGCSASGLATPADEEASSDEAEPSRDSETDSEGERRIVEKNRLLHETSPYLRQHGHNPVDWYPWGGEALAKAKEEEKVIFLSIGYSSCHWCHVMERESFLDKEIAGFLNEHFVCIKVDREERPDIDSIYMTALQVYNRASGSGGGGGWPMSMFLLPDARPFFGGTYFPPRDGDRGARLGFLSLVRKIEEIWQGQRDNLERDAETLTSLVKQEADGRRPAPLSALNQSLFAQSVSALEERFDPVYGGFGYHEANPRMPKFPEPPNLLFLVDQIRDEQATDELRQSCRKMLTVTLEKMALGGIRDHLGGGFHRYSVDRYWKIPHFEKMLYDNGQLASVYSEAYALTEREDFRRVVIEMLDFVRREMTSSEGVFYAALDADSEDVEGKFYRWEVEEIRQLLGAPQYDLFAEIYRLDEPPNFEEYYALELDGPLAKLSAEHNMSESKMVESLKPLRAKLLAARDQRPRPLTDTKVLTSWNGLMIRGFADAGRILEDPSYLQDAVKAADFLLNTVRDERGRLRRTFSAGESKLNAYLDDYAFFVDGLIALHRATGDQRWLEEAERLTATQIELFWDDEGGGFFFTSGDHETLIARGRDLIDGVEPSGNAVAAQNLLYLAEQLQNESYDEKIELTLRSVAGLLSAAPAAAPRMMTALAVWLDRQGGAPDEQE